MTNAPLAGPESLLAPGHLPAPAEFATSAIHGIASILPAALAIGIGFLGLKAIVTGENPLNGILGKKTVS